MINPIEKHEPFLTGEILPLVFAQARKVSAPSEEVVLACFVAMAIVLQHRGYGNDELLANIRGLAPDAHPASRTIQ